MRGELSRVHGDDEVARVAYEEGRDLAIVAGDDAHLSVFLLNLSYLADHRGEYEESRQALFRFAPALSSAWSPNDGRVEGVRAGRP